MQTSQIYQQSVSLIHILSSITTWLVLTPLLFVLLRIAFPARYTKLHEAPIAGAKWPLEPSFITRLRFISNGWEVTRDGWEKCRDNAYTILRPDSNVTVLPLRCIEEIHNLPSERLHGMQALTDDMMGKYSGADINLGSRLNWKVVQTRLTPNIAALMPYMEEEIEYGIIQEFPPCRDEWAETSLVKTITRITARLTFRLWIGQPLCRNEDFLTTFLGAVRNIFLTAIILRALPAALQPLVGPFLPTRRRLEQSLVRLRSFLIPEILERRRQAVEDPDWEPRSDFLQWMMELAADEEGEADNLANRFVWTVNASLFFVSAGIVDCLYDLIAHPEYVESLREEAARVIREEGGWGKGVPPKLLMMDSFMKESQRLNAPSPIQFRRVVRTPLVLSGGLQLPVGAYICLANARISATPPTPLDDTPDHPPDVFYPWRYFVLQSSAAYEARYQYASTDTQHITFGYGRHACPGRFVASVQTKMVLVKVLQKFEMRFADGTKTDERSGRPKKKQLLEFGMHDPDVMVLVRERK